VPSKAIYHLLTTDATLAAVIGNRVYPTVSKMAANTPMVVYNTVSVTPTDFKQAPSDIDYVMVQIDAFAPDASTVIGIAKRIRQILDRYPHSTVAGVHLAGVSYRNEMQDWNDTDKVYRIMQEYQFRIRR
jgi:hypothetical protein